MLAPYNPCVQALRPRGRRRTASRRVATRRVGANARDGICCNNAHAEFRKRH